MHDSAESPMLVEAQIMCLLEELLDSDLSPEEVCRDHPELLSEVKARLAELRRVDAELEELFPTPGPMPKCITPRPAVNKKLPEIPGYRIESLLGHGGMGVVYKATHLRLNRTVALKMMLVGEYASERERERFIHEAEAVAALQHPNIVQVFDVGELDSGLYYSMEFVEGGTLAQKWDGMPQPARDAAALVITLAEAVQSAHDHNIIHRDLKPGNILLTVAQTPKISDFGLARRLDDNPALTIPGARVGTPSYMAPEQARGNASEIGPGVDIYALGAILYEALTGRPPFRAETASETERQLLESVPVPPSRLNTKVPRDLETICLKCLQKESHRRYASAAGLADDIKRFLHHEPIHARPAGLLERLFRWTQRRPQETALIIAGCALIVVAAVAGAREWNRVLQQRAELEKWNQRLAFIIKLEEEGRFTEAREILERVPDGGSAELREQIEIAKNDLAIVERLDAVRMMRGGFFQSGGINYADSARAYEDIFREFELGTFDENPTRAASRLRARPIRSAIVAALDDWATCADREPRDWIFSLARELDADPWRDRVRDSSKWGTGEALEQFMNEADVHTQPLNLLVAMCSRLRRLNGETSEFLRRLQAVHPDDFWVNFELAYTLNTQESSEAIGYYRAALAVRPDAPIVHFNLGNHMFSAGDLEASAHHFKQALTVDPNHTWAHLHHGYVMLHLDRNAEALASLDKSLALDPDQPEGARARRMALIRLGRIEDVRREWEQLLQAESLQHEDWDGYAELCLFLGHESEYHRACRELLKRFSNEKDAHICERIGRACLFAPASEDILLQGAALIDRALAAKASEPDYWALPYFRVSQALAHYRAGRLEQALTLLQDEALNVLPPAPQLLQAMLFYKTGKHHEARERLHSAIENFDWRIERADNREAWIYHLLRREVEDLMDPE